MDKPTLGRIVHFVLPDLSECAAIVTNPLDGNLVNLHLFLDHGVTGSHDGRSVPFDPTHESSPSWHWPDRPPSQLPTLAVASVDSMAFKSAVVTMHKSLGGGVYTGLLNGRTASGVALAPDRRIEGIETICPCIVLNAGEFQTPRRLPHVDLDKPITVGGIMLGSDQGGMPVVLVSLLSIGSDDGPIIPTNPISDPPSSKPTSTSAIVGDGDAGLASTNASNGEDAGESEPTNPTIPPAANVGSKPSLVEGAPQ